MFEHISLHSIASCASLNY